MASVSIDPRILIRPSKAMLDLIEAMDPVPKELQSVIHDNEVTVPQLKVIQAKHKEMKWTTPIFDMISRESIDLPEPKFAERNPELEKRVQKLKQQQENREYQRMTQNLTEFGFPKTSKGDDVSISKQMKELNNYLVLIFQFIFSVLTSFAAGYLAPYFFWGVVDVGQRLIIGIVLAFLVAMADLYFIFRFFLQAEGVVDFVALDKKYQ